MEKIKRYAYNFLSTVFFFFGAEMLGTWFMVMALPKRNVDKPSTEDEWFDNNCFDCSTLGSIQSLDQVTTCFFDSDAANSLPIELVSSVKVPFHIYDVN